MFEMCLQQGSDTTTTKMLSDRGTGSSYLSQHICVMLKFADL